MGGVVDGAARARTVWAWIAVGLTPVGCAVAWALVTGVDGQFPEARLVGSVVAAVVALIAPTAGVVLGFLSGDRPSGRVAMGLSSALLVCVGFALVAYVQSTVALVMAIYCYAVAMVAVLAFAQSAARRRGPTGVTSPRA